METVLIILFCVFGASLLSLIILLLTLKNTEPGQTVVVIKDKRNKEQPKAEKVKPKAEPKEEKPKKTEKKDEGLILKPVYAAISFGCKCGQKILVQEQNLGKDIVCPKCNTVINKEEEFKKVLKDELTNQTKAQELFLGMCYLYGVGVKKDDKKAYLFVNLSAYNGDEVAKQMLQNYYSEDIAKLTKENIKDATSEKLEMLIKEQKLQLSKVQFEPKTINELHNYAIDYFWWATYHRMNNFDVDELAQVGSANINSSRILNVAEGFDEIDLTSLESKLAFAYLDIAANNGRYDLFAELGFAYVGFDNDQAKKYLKKGMECGDERSKELYAVYFEGKSIDQVRIEKLEAPKEVILLEQKPAKAKKAKETKKAKEAEAKAVKAEPKEVSAEQVFEAEKPAKKATKKATTAKKAKKATKPAKAKEEAAKPAEKKASVVKKKKPATKKAEPKVETKNDGKSKDEILQEIKEKSKDTNLEEKSDAEKLAQKVEKLEQKVEKLEEKAEEKPAEKKEDKKGDNK